MRIFFIIFLIIYPYYLNSKVINLKYEIDWKSIHLADLFWKIKIEDNLYEIDFTIKSYGVTDKIYGYESITKVSGEIKDDSASFNRLRFAYTSAKLFRLISKREEYFPWDCSAAATAKLRFFSADL